MNTRISLEQLEQMKTHELAELLANVVLVLRRMPNVQCDQLALQVPNETPITEQKPKKPRKARQTEEAVPQNRLSPASSSRMSADELEEKTIPQLKKIATEMLLLVSSKPTKKELVQKILARQGHEHSEQYAIRDI